MRSVKSLRTAGALLLTALSVVGCYNPNIVEGGLMCGPNRACPDDYKCASNSRCYRRDAGTDVPAAPQCMSTTPDAATCSRPLDGQPCNPACEYGCSCGWCAVSGGAVSCLTGKPGTKKVGDTCDSSNATDCSPGLYCLAECGTAHCHKYCDRAHDNADCASLGTTCSVTAINNKSYQFSVCALPQNACNPVTGGGCASGFACFAFSASVECDCAGTKTTGMGCKLLQDCAPGYTCINAGGDQSCRKTCMTNGECPSGTTCVNQSPTYGYCQ